MTDGRTDDERCPHCGAEWSDSRLTFACGSYERSDGIKRHPHCYQREIAALQTELAKRQWQPIETAPKDGQRVLCRYAGVYEVRVVTFWRDGGGSAHFGLPNEPDGKGSQPATHWQPLPEPPKE